VQIKKSFKPTSISKKNCGYKFLPKSSEMTLSKKSKYLLSSDNFLYQMMIFRDLSIWCIDNFMKLPQLNKKYPSGAAKGRKKEERIKLMKNVGVSWIGLLL